MQILKCSLTEFKTQFPSYKEEVKEDSKLLYYKVRLDTKEFVGIVKDTETRLIDFVEIERARGMLKNDPNFEYNLLSLFADKFETRNFDSPMVEPTVDVFVKKEDSDKELARVKKIDIIARVINTITVLVVIVIIAIALCIKGIGK